MLVDHVPDPVMVEERVAVHQNVAEGDDGRHVGNAGRGLRIQPRQLRNRPADVLQPTFCRCRSTAERK
jgi:hypothetical protein